MTRVDYCVTAMDRPKALERLLFSIAAHSPDAPIHVADQSERFDPEDYEELGERLEGAGLRRRPTIHRLPFDCGVACARNYLADAAGAEYVLSLDDDFAFTEETNVDAMVRLLDQQPQAAMVAGAVTRNGEVRHEGTRLRRTDDSVSEVRCDAPFGKCAEIRFKQTDFVPLFVLTRRSFFPRMRWDGALKTGGGPHLDFFIELLKMQGTVLYTPDVKIDHPPTEVDQTYRQRRRRLEFLGAMLEKHGLKRVKLISGLVAELRPDGSVAIFNELRRSQ